MDCVYYRTVTVDHTLVPSTQTNFSLLISLTHNDLKSRGNGGHVQSANGYDIGPFTDAALKSPITGYELVYYGASTGTVILRVLIASLSSSVDTVVYLGYGDPAISTFQGTPTSAWDSSVKGAYSLGDGTSLSAADSTINAAHGTLVNAPTAGAGQVDGCASLVAASTQYISLPSATGTAALTYCAWVKATSFPNAYNAVISFIETSLASYHSLYVNASGKLAAYVKGTGGNVSYDANGSFTLSAGTWCFVAITYDSVAGLIGYVNANVDQTAAASGTLLTNAAVTRIGSDPINAGREWNGLIDEPRIWNVALPANTVTAIYNNEVNPSAFHAIGAEQSAHALFAQMCM